MSRPDVILSGIDVRRRDRTILHVEDLVVAQRSFLGIVGPNGAGKTTLLNVCAGLVRAAGRAQVLGQDVEGLSEWARADLRRSIGYVPQRADYYPDIPLTVREVVALGRVGPRGLFRRLTARDHKLVDEWVEKLGLRDLAVQPFRSLSGGEQQKVLIARAMTQEPKLLLLDEPASNLDIDWKEKLVALLAELYADTGVTVLMVSHETELLPACVTYVVLMKTGTILCQGSPSEVLTRHNLSEAYGCFVEVVRLNGRFRALPVCAKLSSHSREQSR